MGYSTDFEGVFTLDHPLTPAHAAYLHAFATTRRMTRDSALAEAMPDPLRLAVNLPIGKEGAYFVGGGGFKGQEHDASVVDYNDPPAGQPGLWCNWVPTEDGSSIEWDGGEKFYFYTEWLEYLCEHFLGPWGYRLNGEVKWRGEAREDLGILTAKDNVVCARKQDIR